MRKGLVVGLAALGLVGCGPGKVSGTVSGQSLAVSDGISSQIDILGIKAVLVALDDKPNMCQAITNNESQANSTVLSISLVDAKVDGSSITSNDVTPGDYPIVAAGSSNGKSSGASWEKSDSACKGTATKATAGKVTLTKIKTGSGGSAEGTFDLNFGNDHITGSFSTPYCTIPLNINETFPDGGSSIPCK